MKARFLALAALVLGLASCQTEPEGLNVNVGGEVDTTITVSLPETTRATDSAEGAFENVDLNEYTIRYILQVYYKNEPSQERLVQYTDGREVTFDVRLVPGRDYNFVVWADLVKGNTFQENVWNNEDGLHYNTTDLHNITLKQTWVAMDETRDAFTGYFNTADGDKRYSAGLPINITLKRPFAKLRVITTDMKELGYLGIEPHNAVVTYTTQFHESFNAFNGQYGAETVSKTHTGFEIKAYDDNVAKKSKVLFTDYFFADDSDVVKFVMNVNEANGTLIKSNTFNTDIAVKRNHLTTIQGNILTEGNNITVEVEDTFENSSTWNPAEDEYDVEVVDVFDTDSFKAALTATSTDVVINANGAEINLNNGLTKTAIPAGRTVTICNANVVGRSYGNGVDGTVIFENCTFNNATGAYSIHFDKGDGDVIFNNCDLYGWNSFGSTLNSVSFENCTLTGNGTYALIRSYVALSLKDCVINITNADHTDNYSEGVEAVGGATMTAENVVYEVSNQDGLNYTLKAGAKNITLLAGEYELSTLNFTDGTYTLKGADIDYVVLKLSKSIYLSNKGITLETLTFKVPAGLTYNESQYAFIHHATEFNMNNCVIDGGRLRLNVNEANIDNCQFNVTASSGFDGYGLFYYGNNNSTVNISNSTFTALQKAVVLYNEGAVTMNLNVDRCTFSASQSADKAAISIHSEWGINGNVNITNSRATGFADFNGGLWRDVNNNTGTNNNKFNVTVDGVQVQVAGYAPVANYPNIFAKEGNYYVFSVAGLRDLNNYFKTNWCGNNTWTPEYNIAADIDATGFTWDGVYLNVGWNGNNGIVLNGNGHTISNLTINNYLLSGTPCGGNDGVSPGLVKDITMKNVTVNGSSHDAAIFWGNCFTNVDFENVTVDGAKIMGGSNVGALVSRTSIEGPNTEIKVNFKNCVVKNSTLEANNTNADPNGASGFIGRTYGNTKLTFEGCSVENNTIKNTEGLVGGAVYGYTTWYGDGFKGTGACDTFTNWNGLVIKEVSTVEELNSLNATNAYVVLCADIDFQNASMTKPIELWGNSTFDGMGHKISNVKTPVQGGYATSLFRGDANSGNKIVKNLDIENLTTPTGYKYAAAIWSDLQGANIEIDNVDINNSTIEANGTIGGFVGFVSASTTSVVIKNSSINNSNLNGGEADHKRGAVVGRAYGCTVTCKDVVVDNVKINYVAATTATLVGDKCYTGNVTVR